MLSTDSRYTAVQCSEHNKYQQTSLDKHVVLGTISTREFQHMNLILKSSFLQLSSLSTASSVKECDQPFQSQLRTRRACDVKQPLEAQTFPSTSKSALRYSNRVGNLGFLGVIHTVDTLQNL